VPSEERLRADESQELPPLDEPGEEDQRDPRGVVRAPRLDIALEIVRQLLPEEQVLGGEVRAGPEDQRRKSPEIMRESESGSNHWRDDTAPRESKRAGQQTSACQSLENTGGRPLRFLRSTGALNVGVPASRVCDLRNRRSNTVL